MRVLYTHRLNELDDGGHMCLAAFDVELNDHIRLYGLRLLRMRDGKHLVYAPNAGRRRSATFSTPMAERLTNLALAAYEAEA